MHVIVADYGQEELEVYEEVKVWKSFAFGEGTVKKSFKLFGVFNKVNADVYVQRTLTVFSGMIAFYAKLRRKRFVYMVAHDREVDGTHEEFKSSIKRKIMESVFHLSDLVMVQNEYEYDFLVKKINEDKVKLLKKGLYISKLETSPELYDCIWIGRCTELKEPELFIELAKKHPSFKFLMICSEATNKAVYYQKMLWLSKEASNLVFVKYASNEKIYDFLRQSKIYCFTSIQEGDWPMVILEATACGLPILSYKLNYSYLIDDYEGGILCNGSMEEMSGNLVKLLADDDLRKKLGRNSYRYATEKHDITKNAHQFVKIVREGSSATAKSIFNQ